MSTAEPLLTIFFVIGVYFYFYYDRQNMPMERQVADFLMENTVFSMR
jgi:hypothetical protein